LATDVTSIGMSPPWAPIEAWPLGESIDEWQLGGTDRGAVGGG
jgi:hypothetical protein